MDFGTYLARGAYRPIYHMCEASAFEAALSAEGGNGKYYPPTFAADGFIHATADPQLLIPVANNFYKEASGKWICVEISVAWLDCPVIYESPMPVGNIASNSDSSIKFPHIYGGIRRLAVKRCFDMTRDADGTFTGIAELASS